VGEKLRWEESSEGREKGGFIFEKKKEKVAVYWEGKPKKGKRGRKEDKWNSEWTFLLGRITSGGADLSRGWGPRLLYGGRNNFLLEGGGPFFIMTGIKNGEGWVIGFIGNGGGSQRRLEGWFTRRSLVAYANEEKKVFRKKQKGSLHRRKKKFCPRTYNWMRRGKDYPGKW